MTASVDSGPASLRVASSIAFVGLFFLYSSIAFSVRYHFIKSVSGSPSLSSSRASKVCCGWPSSSSAASAGASATATAAAGGAGAGEAAGAPSSRAPASYQLSTAVSAATRLQRTGGRTAASSTSASARPTSARAAQILPHDAIRSSIAEVEWCSSLEIRATSSSYPLHAATSAPRAMPPRPPKAKAAPASASKQVRSLERLLKRELPAHVRREKEAALAALQQQAQKAKRTQRERAFSKKYHKVKFFERRKVERRIAHLKKQLEGAGPKAQPELRRQLQAAEHDLLYVQHFPRHKKYLSLFPVAGTDDAFVAKRRERIRAAIVRRAEAGTLRARAADDGDDEDEDAVDEAPPVEAERRPKRPKASAKPKRARRPEAG